MKLKHLLSAGCALAIAAGAAQAAFTEQVYFESFPASGTAAGVTVHAGNWVPSTSGVDNRFLFVGDATNNIGLITYDGLLTNGDAGSSLTDYRVWGYTSQSGPVQAGVVGRYTDGDNFYYTLRIIGDSGTDEYQIRKRVGGVDELVDSVNTPHAAAPRA